MRVLIVLKNSPIKRYLVHLYTEALIREVRELVNSRRHGQAMVAALSKGSFQRTVTDDEVHAVEADLILSENSASWDLIK